MGLLELELKEIRQDMKHYRSGKLKAEDVQNLIGLYSQSEKRARLIISLISLGAKFGRKEYQKAVQTNLLGTGAIELSHEEIEDEAVMCPHKGCTISRGNCLDFSGEEKNFEICKDCDTGKENKRLILAESPMYTA